MEETKTYWNGNGKHQELYNAQWDELVPGNGKAGTMQGEVLRAASRLYYRWFNDGDRIQQYGRRPESSAEDAWAFLHEAHTLLPGDEGKDALKAIAEIVADAALAKSEEGYEEALERLADAATLYAATRPLVQTDEDFVGNGWDEVCEQECGLYDPDGVDEDEFYEEDDEE
jgi:hypothetical protein